MEPTWQTSIRSTTVIDMASIKVAGEQVKFIHVCISLQGITAYMPKRPDRHYLNYVSLLFENFYKANLPTCYILTPAFQLTMCHRW